MSRTKSAFVLLALLVAASGCSGVLSGPVSFSASEATVGDAALDATGYEHNQTAKVGFSRNVSVGGQSKRIEVTNWIAEYERQVELPGVGERPAAAFVTFASPKGEVLGESFNPIARYDDHELAERFGDHLQKSDDVRVVGSRNRTMLGTTTEVTKLATTVTTSRGVEFDAYVHVATVEHEGDVVVAIAVHPRKLSGQEKQVDRLLEGVQHGE